MYEHLGTRTNQTTSGAMRIDLWDTGQVDELGKSVLRYALYVETTAVEFNGREGTGVIYEGEDFHCSPLVAIDSDEAFGSIVAFFAHYGESIYYSREGEGDDIPVEGVLHRAALRAEHEELALWASELERGERDDEHTDDVADFLDHVGPTLTPVPGAEPRYVDGVEMVEIATCGTCGRSWNDAAISGVTPVPSGRCPFEYEHGE